MKSRSKFFIVFILTFLLSCCGGGGDSGTDTTQGDNNNGGTSPTGKPPSAIIRADWLSGPAPLVVHVDGSASVGEMIKLMTWDYGDGVIESEVSSAHTYTLPGKYSLRLTVEDSQGLTDTAEAVINVEEHEPPKPPLQLNWGPGGNDYKFASINTTSYGDGAQRYWIYEPESYSSDSTFPIIIFNHGFGVTDPALYTMWIEHIVRRGHIVIYPQYQELSTPPAQFTSNAIAAVKSAMIELRNEDDHATPDFSRVAVVGHSWGGVISANMVSLSTSDPEFPKIAAIQCNEPGTGGLGNYEDYANIPKDTLLLCIAGEDDKLVGDTDAKKIFLEASLIPFKNKDFILVRSDNYGFPALVADHGAPTDVVGSNGTLRWYGFWKWFDALCDTAFWGKNEEFALGNGFQQRFMGYWSDGTPVKEPIITDDIAF